MPALISYSAGDSPFHQMAPLTKLAAALAVTVASVAARSVGAQALLLGSTVVASFLFADIRLRRLAAILPIMLLFTLSYFLINVVAGTGTTPLFEWAGIVVSREAVENAGIVALRWMLFLSVAIIFVTTTEPLLFAVALSSRLRLPTGASLLVFLALRMAHIYEHEFRALSRTHRLRYQGRSKGLRGGVLKLLRLGRALLARGLGRAHTLSASMAVRGAEGGGRLQADQETGIGARDLLCLGGTASVSWAALSFF